LEPFVQGGYTPGWVPYQQHHRGMETFVPDFVAAFSR
jgi:hypothetical protein